MYTLNKETLWEECKKYEIIQKPEEYFSLLNLLIDNNVKTILEIGSEHGGTTRGFIDISEKTYSIDVFKHKSLSILEETFKDKYKFLKSDSHDISTYNQIKEIMNNEKVDFLFIDGDHSYEGSLLDFNMYKDLVKPGGIIAFHDIVASPYHHSVNCFVDKMWAEIKNDYKHIEYKFGDNDWAGIGVLFV